MTSMALFGMKRAGQHAVINWLCSQMTPSIHRNDCRFAIKDDTGEIHLVSQHNPIYFGDFDNNQHPRLELFNMEDYDVNFDIRARMPNGDQSKIIVVVRDLYNLMASRRKRSEGKVTFYITERIWFNPIETWKQHVSFLDDNQDGIIPVNFNNWFDDYQYRKHISDRIGIEDFSDQGINCVFTPGDSSFDGEEYHGKAQGMDIMGRWRHYENDPEYRALFTDELRDLNLEYFGFAPF